MDQPQVVEVSPQNFQSAVVERSRETPVVLLFWAQQVAPSVDARRTLETLATQYQGKFLLALADVAQDPTLAQHLQVQGLPSLRVVRDGQLVDQLEGPQDEAVLRQMLDRLTMSSGDLLRAQLQEILDAGDLQAALQLLQQAVQEEPGNPAFKVELADVLIRAGEVADARQVLAGLPEDAPDRERPDTRLTLVEEAQDLPPAEQLAADCASNPDDLALRYQYAIALAATDQIAAALDEAMFILQTDREFRDDIGRLTMLRLFKVLGKGSDLAGRYRRRMFNFLH